MKPTVFVSEYLLSFPGGAERSIWEELKLLGRKEDVVVYTFDAYYPKGKEVRDGITVVNFGLRREVPLSRFLEIILNKRYIERNLERIVPGARRILTQSLIAPMVARSAMAHRVPYTYYIRDELHLNVFSNYESGRRRLMKTAKDMVELPATMWYRRLNGRALRGADGIITNSQYMRKLLRERFGLSSKVQYPRIDRSVFSPAKLESRDQRYVTFIGAGNAMKGWRKALVIAKNMPEQDFLFVGPYSHEWTEENITYTPFSHDPIDLYRRTKILLVPSKWNEAFGRVVVEARLLGIPAVTSDRGGLPEANPDKPLVLPYDAPTQQWVEAIRKCATDGTT